jgi:hypothetical protein
MPTTHALRGFPFVARPLCQEKDPLANDENLAASVAEITPGFKQKIDAFDGMRPVRSYSKNTTSSSGAIRGSLDDFSLPI